VKKHVLAIAILVILALLVVACSAEPETVEVTRIITETETETIEVTRIVEVEGETVTEVQEVEVPVEVTRIVEVPAEAAIVRVAFPSSIDIDDIAAMLAFEKMQDEGFAVAPTFYAQGELAAAAVAGGQADFGTGASTIWLSAIQAGEPLAGIMEQSANGWSVMGINDVEDCEDIDGMRTAIHSEGSVSTAMLRAYIDEVCPDIEPNYLVIPGSENRAAALMAGEIDVTPSELIDSIRIMELQPGEFHRIANFATDLPGLKTGGYWVSKEFAEENPEAVESFIRNVLEIHRRINNEPEWFIEQVPRFLEMEDEDIALLPQIVDALLAVNNYPINGGLTQESAQFTIDFFTNSERLEPGLTAEEAFDLSYLESVLAEIGEQ
jgi:ABC-type nitrate/sulfonate/bicarbonate transport system substrate-binding protein